MLAKADLVLANGWKPPLLSVYLMLANG